MKIICGKCGTEIYQEVPLCHHCQLRYDEKLRDIRESKLRALNSINRRSRRSIESEYDRFERPRLRSDI